jgi:hypothetical protein
MLHLKIKPFNVNVRDWSSDVRNPASLYQDSVLTVPPAATRDNYACDTYQLLEPDKLALGALYVSITHTHAHY